MKKHKYILTLEFESELPVEKNTGELVQFENGIGYFVETKKNTWNKSLNETFIYGSGKTKLKKVKQKTKK